MICSMGCGVGYPSPSREAKDPVSGSGFGALPNSGSSELPAGSTTVPGSGAGLANPVCPWRVCSRISQSPGERHGEGESHPSHHRTKGEAIGGFSATSYDQ